LDFKDNFLGEEQIMAYNINATRDSQDHLGKFYERAIRASTPIEKPLNHIDSLNQDIQKYIGDFLSPCQSYDWELACQGEEVLALLEDEEYYKEDLTKDWRDDPRQDWEDDFDLYQDWEQDSEDEGYYDDRYENYGDCYVDEYD
jgi:hypothetical protein